MPDTYSKDDCKEKHDEMKKLLSDSESRTNESIKKIEDGINRLWSRIDSDREKVVTETKEIVKAFDKYKDRVSRDNKVLMVGIIIQLVVMIIIWLKG